MEGAKTKPEFNDIPFSVIANYLLKTTYALFSVLIILCMIFLFQIIAAKDWQGQLITAARQSLHLPALNKKRLSCREKPFRLIFRVRNYPAERAILVAIENQTYKCLHKHYTITNCIVYVETNAGTGNYLPL